MERYAVLPSLYLDAPGHSLKLLVEARLQRGLPRCQINGLNGTSSRETADRIRNAIHACGVRIPHMGLSVNIAPVDIRKSGAYLDLSIAISILLTLQDTLPPANPLLAQSRQQKKILYLGELSLSGRILPVSALHSLLWEARKQAFQSVVLPLEQLGSAQLIPDLEFIPLGHLQELLQSKTTLIPQKAKVQIQGGRPPSHIEYLNLSPRVQKAIALCAAGWHSLLLIGPPGSGKSSIAREILSLLPPPSPEEAIEILINQEQSIELEERKTSAEKSQNIQVFRPLRAPHHSLTPRAMIGGGSPIKAGEASRAHNGLLLLDELGEFSRETLQTLREALQERKIQISRSSYTLNLPARFLLCATSNPCPCGDLSKRYISCACTDASLKNYMSKFAASLRDRIDIEVWVDRKDVKSITEETTKESEEKPSTTNFPGTEKLFHSISQAHKIQSQRLANTPFRFNADIEAKELENYIPLKDPQAQKEWQVLSNTSQINYRALAGIRRLARTLADLESIAEVRAQDLLEAASYRCLERIWS